MQTLGLSSKPQPADNIFERLFWPSIDGQYDVDLIGQQGFYVLLLIAAMSLILLAVLNHPLVGLFTGLVYFLAACGVRERSVAAATLAAVLYAVNFVGGIFIGSMGNPLIQIVVLMLLFANVRATLLSRRWLAQPSIANDFDFEERSTEGAMDRVANRLPTKVWPVGRYFFFPLAGILLLLTVAGLVATKRASEQRKTLPVVQPMRAVLPPVQ